MLSSGATVESVSNYLPRNYSARFDPLIGRIVIEGWDDHGWTLDRYVLPRLGSGLIAAKEEPR